ncbi:4Fe-4S binding protein [Anaerotruncus colihominis]|nr:4Fe-4S binding protein [Anaerotruncus colihominis]
MQTLQEKPMNGLARCDILGPVAYIFDAANTGSWRIERPQVDASACIKCGICQRYCPADVITIHKDQPDCVEFMWDYCKGCGICANECPKGCIQMVSERGDA